jgi:predicted ATPase/class 3 adenylate cyclase
VVARPLTRDNGRVQSELPTGTVTFLFTDVEGSTNLLHELGPEDYSRALAAHRRILRAAFAANEGVEVDTQGDALFVAFPTAPGALAAAAEAQAGLASGQIRVRVGIHTGTPHMGEEGYIGVDVHRAARIAACGHGGQVLVSQTTHDLTGNGLRDLGEHRLKDLSAPERIYQLGDRDFPPLKTLYQTNLPVPATPFLGREDELAAVRELLADTDLRLLTLTGAGGSGKTRLALQAAGAAADGYPGGVWWVALAPVSDPATVFETAAAALGVSASLEEAIGERRLLLLLDNFEHLIEAAPRLTPLFASCPGLDLVVTSRERLQLQGEHVYPVPVLARSEARTLFTSRARAVRPDFEETPELDELCARLDDLPLALELAAARTAILSAAQLLSRLGSRLDLLRGGRDAEMRQQTLRATIEWSYHLLEREEQRLFARLAVFQGGCTLEAAEEVVRADLETLQSLVDKSLVRRAGERLWMLETIRDFALERLAELRDADELRHRHSEYFRALARRAEEGLRGVQEALWLDVLETEHANLRSVLARGDGDLQLELAGAVARFWSARGHLEEGSRQLHRLLRQPSTNAALRAKALHGAAQVAFYKGDAEATHAYAEEALELFEGLGDRAGVARSLSDLGNAAVRAGEYDRAREFYEGCRDVASEAGDRRYVAGAIVNLGDVALLQGDWERARALASEGLVLSREQDAGDMIATVLSNAGLAAFRLGDYDEAAARSRECLELVRELRAKTFVASWLIVPAALAGARGRPAEGFLLLALARARVEAGEGVIFGAEQKLCDETLALLDSQLDAETVSEAEAEAAASRSSFEDVLAYALESLSRTAPADARRHNDAAADRGR